MVLEKYFDFFDKNFFNEREIVGYFFFVFLFSFKVV